MQPNSCPHCGLKLETSASRALLRCPNCYNSFRFSSTTQWTMLVVPILSILYYINFAI